VSQRDGQRIGFHAFRHTAVSTWLRHPLSGGYGWSLKDASRVAGHSSSVITERIYWHFFEDELPTVPSMPVAPVPAALMEVTA
jgi:integrase